MAVHVGINSNTKKQISSMYIGVDGNKKEVITAYANKNGTVAKVYANKPKGQKIFTTSGTFTIPDRVTSVDIFLVGGGGAGGASCLTNNYYNNSNAPYYSNGHGGGGGYTKTVKGVSVTPGKSYSIVVGAGAASQSNDSPALTRGGDSSGLGYSVGGGFSGYNNYESGDITNSAGGGSGGGKGGYSCEKVIWTGFSAGGAGGDNGSNGWKGSTGSDPSKYQLSTSTKVCVGQGTTTRAFGESSGSFYSGGGAGASAYVHEKYKPNGGYPGGGDGSCRWEVWSGTGWTNNNSWARTATKGDHGTGGGGGGAWIHEASGAGGSGCVIIRWGY